MVSATEIEIQAKSESIRRSIRELNSMIETGEPPIPNGPLREQYYQVLGKLLEQEAEVWYQLGFERCHKTLFKKGEVKTVSVSKKMRISSELFLPVQVHLVSQIPASMIRPQAKRTTKVEAPKRRRPSLPAR
jgi:hypothetical protein